MKFDPKAKILTRFFSNLIWAGVALDALTDYVAASLKKGDEVNFAPLGKFKVSARAAREGRNPMSGEKIKIPASNVPKFTPSKQLKEEVNSKRK